MMKTMLYRVLFAVALVGLVLGVAVYRSLPSSAIQIHPSYPPLNAGIGSPGAVIDESVQAIENPVFFALVKADWPLLEIAEPRTAWEYVQRGMYRQDDLEDEDAAVEDYLQAEELLEEIAARTGDETLPERMLLIHLRLGPIYLHRGEWENAIHEFDVVLEENPESEGIHREIALAYLGMGKELLEEGHDAEAQEAFQEAYDYFNHETEIAPFNQLTLYEFGEFLLEPEVHLEEVDQPALARELFQRYLARAEQHCDTYPVRILKVDKEARELGGAGSALAIENCVERKAVQ